jgi:hypothetical protein
MPTAKDQATVKDLLAQPGQTSAAQAGIRLKDAPAPLYQLLVLATLLSARISADVAVAAARELFASGYRTPRAMLRAGWQERVAALDRGHYRRYDERTATMLGEGARLLLERWRGDLRILRTAGGDAEGVASLLTQLPGIGPAGSGIFLREVQDLWPQVGPYLDEKAADGARKAGLPADPGALAGLAGRGNMARLCAALVRLSRTKQAPAPVA